MLWEEWAAFKDSKRIGMIRGDLGGSGPWASFGGDVESVERLGEDAAGRDSSFSTHGSRK